jgi:ABC-type transporter Mla subunit MlaD
MQFNPPPAPRDPNTIHREHVAAHEVTLSTIPKATELEQLAAHNAAAEKATRKAAELKALLAERHNEFVDLANALVRLEKQDECAKAQLAQAAGNVREKLATLQVGAFAGVFHSAYMFAREISIDKIGAEILREKVAETDFPGQVAAAKQSLRDFIKTHGVPRELWPASLLK